MGRVLLGAGAAGLRPVQRPRRAARPRPARAPAWPLVDNRSAMGARPNCGSIRTPKGRRHFNAPQRLGEPAVLYRLTRLAYRAPRPHPMHITPTPELAAPPFPYISRHYLTQLVQQVQRLELSDRESELRQVCTLLYYYFFLCNPLAARYSLSLRHSLSVPLAARRGGGAARASRRVDAGGAQEQTRGDAAQRCSRVPY